jgi:hypothetical protein
MRHYILQIEDADGDTLILDSDTDSLGQVMISIRPQGYPLHEPVATVMLELDDIAGVVSHLKQIQIEHWQKNERK